MAKNILLTTMSTFSRNYRPPSNKKGFSTPNYYKVSINGTTRYCNGILQTEAGSKFILSKDCKIDKIIAIVSPETVYETDSANEREPDLKTIPDVASFVPEAERRITLHADVEDDPLSPFGYYAYRIGQFLRQVDTQTTNLIASIDEERRQKLEQITDSVLRNANLESEGIWFYLLDSSETDAAKQGNTSGKKSYYKIIQEILRADIEETYIKPEDYPKYKGSVDDLLSKFEIKTTLDDLKDQLSVSNADLSRLNDNIKNLQNNVARSYSIKSFAKEIWLRIYQQFLEKNIADIEKEVTVEKASVYEKLIEVLKNAVENLLIELRNLKTSRQQSEENYIKSYLYRKLDGKHKILPNSCNQVISLTYIKDKVPVNNPAGSERTYVTNIAGIVNAICPEGTTDDINLYIDMQGGSRTQGYVLNAVLMILNNESSNKVSVRGIFTTKYEAKQFTSEICDETKQYKIIDLASGMNAFIQYGRADQIDTYFKTVYDGAIPHEKIRDLISEMKNVDHSLSICDINNLERSIIRIYDIFSSGQYNDVSDEFSGSFNAMVDEIRQDYSILLAPSFPGRNARWRIDYLELTRWAYRKHFIQQAITIIESKMPKFFIDNGILYYRRTRDNNTLTNYIRDTVVRELIYLTERGTDNPLQSSEWNGDTISKFPWEFKDIDHYLFTKHPYKYYDQTLYERILSDTPSFLSQYDPEIADKSWNMTAKLLSIINIQRRRYMIPLRSEINLADEDNLYLLKETLFLYYYLRNIRNEINHSSDANRVSFETVDQLIDKFISLCSNLSALTSNASFTASHTDSATIYNRAIRLHNNRINNSSISS